MKQLARIMMLMTLAATVLTTSGCRYMANRYYDFRDVFHVGVGVTGENPVTGPLPPALGAYIQLTEYLHLGAITFNGVAAELDMRGSFVGPQSTTQFGFLWWQQYQNYEDYSNACFMNDFKDGEFSWCRRMEQIDMMYHGRPAKALHYEFWSLAAQRGIFLAPRGYQYWGYSGIHLAICEPFLTHAGLMIKLGIDPSEITDFLLGILFIDALKHDDLSRDEFADMRNRAPGHHEILGVDIVPERPRD